MATAKVEKTDAQLMNESVKRRKALVEEYKGEPKVKISISPLYAPYFGKGIQVAINGVCITVPVNGVAHEVPQSFADEITAKIMAVDATINKAAKMSDYQNNKENSAGELKMF